MGLLEREAELAAIGAAMERARAGHGSALVVEGPAGIGKSSLLRAAVDEADGMQVVQAVASPLEQTYAFGVVRTLFEPLRGAASWPELLAGAAGLARPALDPVTSFAGPGEEARHATLHGLTWLVADLAAQAPVVLVVDDAHWADPPSLRWLAHLERRIATLPVLALLAVRSGEPPSDPAVLDALGSGAVRVCPRAMGTRASAALVRARLPDAGAEVCAACHDATGGNPFLLTALAGALAETAAAAGPPTDAARTIARFGPEAVARDVARRLDRLPKGAREVALALAILGPGSAPRLVAELAQVERTRAAEAADALRDAAILEPGGRLAFAHPILAAAVGAQLGPGQTAVWHRRAWRLLHAAGAEPERQSLHLLEAEPEGDAEAVATLRAAARAAMAHGAADTAAAYLRRALAEPPDADTRPAVLLEGGLALAAHRDRAAPALLHEAIARITDPGQRAEAALHAVQALALAALYDDVIAIGRFALADTGDASPDGERDSLVGTVVRGLMLIYNDDLESALDHCEALLAFARPRGWASAVANATWLRAMAQLRLGRVADALEDARAAHAFKVEVGAPPDSLGWAAAPLADALLEHGDPGAAEAVRDARAAAASWALWEADGPGLVGWRLCAVPALVALGRRDEAATLADHALRAAERHGAASSLAGALRAAACARPDDAVPLLHRAVATGRNGERLRALVDLGAALRRRGRLEAARAALREALDRAGRDGAVLLGERARTELVAAGARPRRDALTGAAALTAAERRVATLAATGRTNRQIAQELFVTQRTVETHLTHTFAKLGVGSRDELAAALWPAAAVSA